MNNFTFSSLEYKRPDVAVIQALLQKVEADIRNAESYEAVRTQMLDFDREMGEIGLMFNIAYIRNTLDTTDKFYEDEIAWIQQVAPTLMPLQLAVNDALAESPFRADIEAEFGKQMFVAQELQKSNSARRTSP